jgi:hypothetical protein
MGTDGGVVQPTPSSRAVGRPWMNGSSCDRLLVGLPYPYGPDLEHCVIGNFHIRILCLMPISRREAEYLHQHGQEALERLFEESRVSFTDKRRSSVV